MKSMLSFITCIISSCSLFLVVGIFSFVRGIMGQIDYTWLVQLQREPHLCTLNGGRIVYLRLLLRGLFETLLRKVGSLHKLSCWIREACGMLFSQFWRIFHRPLPSSPSCLFVCFYVQHTESHQKPFSWAASVAEARSMCFGTNGISVVECWVLSLIAVDAHKYSH